MFLSLIDLLWKKNFEFEKEIKQIFRIDRGEINILKANKLIFFYLFSELKAQKITSYVFPTPELNYIETLCGYWMTLVFQAHGFISKYNKMSTEISN